MRKSPSVRSAYLSSINGSRGPSRRHEESARTARNRARTVRDPLGT
jgi:hypothetical protein